MNLNKGLMFKGTPKDLKKSTPDGKFNSGDSVTIKGCKSILTGVNLNPGIYYFVSYDISDGTVFISKTSKGSLTYNIDITNIDY